MTMHPPPAAIRPSIEPEAAEPARGPGRPVGDHVAKRGELLKAAIAMIAEEGFAGASLRKVAQRAGCTTGSVTYYFANKDALVAAVTESLFDEWDAFLDLSQDDIKAGMERFLAWSRAEDSRPWLAQFQLLARARHEPGLAAVFEARYARYRDNMTAILERGQQRGVIRGDIPADLLSDQICAIGDGWMMMFPIEPKRFATARVAALLDALVTLVSPAPAAGRGPNSGPH